MDGAFETILVAKFFELYMHIYSSDFIEYFLSVYILQFQNLIGYIFTNDHVYVFLFWWLIFTRA